MGNIKRWAQAVRSGQPDAMYRALLEIDQKFDYHDARVGGQQLQKTDTPQQSLQRQNPPAPAGFDVQGSSGKFTIQITNPQLRSLPSAQLLKNQKGTNPANAPIYHQVQCGGNMGFTQSDPDFKDYGVTPQTSFEFQNQNKSLYWRVRSSFDGKQWNNWQVFSPSGGSGPAAVASGALGADATTGGGTGGATLPTFNGPIELTGAVDGANGFFTIPDSPNPPGWLWIFRNGMKQRVNVAYVLNGNQITFQAGYIPQPGDDLEAFYLT